MRFLKYISKIPHRSSPIGRTRIRRIDAISKSLELRTCEIPEKPVLKSIKLSKTKPMLMGVNVFSSNNNVKAIIVKVDPKRRTFDLNTRYVRLIMVIVIICKRQKIINIRCPISVNSNASR